MTTTIGCSWNACTYCDMYRAKNFRIRELDEILADIRAADLTYGREIDKVFVADGDPLIMDVEHWQAILTACRRSFPRLRRVSAYATAMNLHQKSADELKELRRLGLGLLYIGPETGDDVTFKRIAKGAGFQDHVDAAHKICAAGMKQSAIFLLGVGGGDRGQEHAQASAKLITAMDPAVVSCLTLTVVPGTPIAKLQDRRQFELPTVEHMLGELRVIVAESEPTDAVFRTNHASNYLPLAGHLPRDRDQIVALIDRALSGEIALRHETTRGL